MCIYPLPYPPLQKSLTCITSSRENPPSSSTIQPISHHKSEGRKREKKLNFIRPMYHGTSELIRAGIVHVGIDSLLSPKNPKRQENPSYNNFLFISRFHPSIHPYSSFCVCQYRPCQEIRRTRPRIHLNASILLPS